MENAPLAAGPETSSESDDSKEDSTKKKKRLGRLPLLRPIQKETVPSDQTADKEKPSAHADKLVEKLLGDKDSETSGSDVANKPTDTTIESSELSFEDESQTDAGDAETATDSPEVDTHDGAVETLDQGEERHAALAYIEQREQELANLGEEDAGAAEDADRSFLSLLRQKLTESGEQTTEDAIEDAYEETISRLDPELAELNSQEETSEDDPTLYTASPVAVAAPANPNASNASSAAGNTPPPGRPPAPPFGPAAANGPGGPTGPTGPNVQSGPNSAGSFGFNAMPANPNTAPTPDTIYLRDNRQAAANLLIGGVVGYFIGRRRGRIKTEKRMGVVQKKLERQVESLHTSIADKEQRIQILAQNVERARPAAANNSQQERSGSSASTTQSRNERMAKESGQVSLRTPEVAAAEVATAPVASIERAPDVRSAAKTERQRQAGQETRQNVAELTDRQVLEMSEKIRVGDTSLKKIYEAKLVSEQGLKNMVREHLAGKDIRRSLAQEFIAKELSFERDPLLRKQLQEQAAGVKGGASTAANDDAPTADDVVRATRTDSAADPTTPPSRAGTKKGKQEISNGLLVALTLFTFGLAAFAVILALTR